MPFSQIPTTTFPKEDKCLHPFDKRNSFITLKYTNILSHSTSSILEISYSKTSLVIKGSHRTHNDKTNVLSAFACCVRHERCHPLSDITNIILNQQ